MNPLESRLDYPLGDTLPPPGRALEVAPGVRWLRMGLPFALNHVNLWLLEDSQATENGPVRGWTVVDCGIADESTREQWEQVFVHELGGLPVLRVIATHCHPDHVGLAHWLCERWRAPLWMTAGEYGAARMMSAALPGTDGEAMLGHFIRHGVRDPAMLEKLAGRREYYPSLVPAMPAAFHRLQQGQPLEIGGRAWQVISGYGHSPEHAALHCPALGVLVSGDMVLPRISTNVSVFAIEPEADPVGAFLQSLQAFRGLPADTLVLPSHGKPFTGLHERIDQLEAHHDERLAEVQTACAERPCSAHEVLPVLFPRALDLHQTTFAMGEAVAHLNRLWLGGRLQRTRDADGVFRFRPQG